MPTKTFFNLPEEKRTRVINAARKEFIRVRDGDIVIKNVVTHAEIPRGSFYQYFDSKEDLVDYLMQTHMRETEECFLEKIKKFDGDILLAFEEIFHNIILGRNKQKLELEKRVIERAKKIQEKKCNVGNCIKPPKFVEEEKILDILDKSKYRIENSNDLESVFYILMGIVMKNIVDFQNDGSEKNAMREFRRDVDYLRYGIKK